MRGIYSKHGKLLRIIVAVTAFLAGSSFFFLSPKWHSVTTFYYVNILVIPWWVYGVLFILAAGFSLSKITRPLGYFIGGCVYLFFALAAWLALLGGIHGGWGVVHIPDWLQITQNTSTNNVLFAASNFSSLAAVYFFLMRLAIIERVDPHRGKIINHE